MTRRTLSFFCAGLIAAVTTMTQIAQAAPNVFVDGAGDTVLRRTDDDCDGFFDEMAHLAPDLVEIRLESFTPDMPNIDPFTGQADENGLFVRIDVIFNGLVNPPGPIGYDDHTPEYEPAVYGPNPVMGYIEFDVDGNEDTGGEDQYPELRYLSNVARFGGVPDEPRFADRAVTGKESIDSDVTTAPYFEASGEEFHLAMLGEEVDSIDIIQEAPGGNYDVFEAGEIWWLTGSFFHKAHAYDDFAVLCGSGGGDYKPEVVIQFAHDTLNNETTVSLVFPKTNVGGAQLISPTANPQSHDGCDDNQYSIKDVLRDLYVGAAFADPGDRNEPAFRFIAGWEFQSNVDLYLDPSGWRVQGLVGTAYIPAPVDNDELIWTDVYPNPVQGDVNGDGTADGADEAAVAQYIALRDGQSEFDTDGDPMNESVAIYQWGWRFSVYDLNYDGLVDHLDVNGSFLVGDMNLDGLIDGRDIGPFVLALLDPTAYQSQFPDANPDVIGDTNDDGALGIDDLAGFQSLLLGM